MRSSFAFAWSNWIKAIVMAFNNEIWLGIRTDGDNMDSGTPTDPYAVNTPSSFTSRLNQLNGYPSRIIRLLPGIYRTWGTAGDSYSLTKASFFLQPGQKIVGSGMFLTTIRLVWDTAEDSTLLPAATQAYAPGQRHYLSWTRRAVKVEARQHIKIVNVDDT